MTTTNKSFIKPLTDSNQKQFTEKKKSKKTQNPIPQKQRIKRKLEENILTPETEEKSY